MRDIVPRFPGEAYCRAVAFCGVASATVAVCGSFCHDSLAN